MLDWNAQQYEMAIGNENCIVTRQTMDKENRKMEPRPRPKAPDKQTSGETKKEMGRRNQWIPQARGNWRDEREWNKEQWHIDQSGKKKKTERWRAMESEYATTAAAVFVDSVQSRRNPPQDPVRPARYLNGVKLDEYEVANIT